MWFKKLSRRWLGRRVAVAESSTLRQQKAPRRSLRLNVEQLEDRTVPSSFTAATVSDLIADINAANQVGGSNTITLVAGNSFSLTAADNSTDGATGLPVIAANDNLTLVGNGDTIARSAAAGTPAFRLLDVAFGASLTLENLTLQNGVAAQGSGVSAEGGAIYNQGTLDLNGVTVQKNIANRAGGAISSHNGALTLEGATNVQSNAATGYVVRGRGFPVAGLGGGLYLAGGTAMLSNVNLSSNTAQGAPGFGQGANGFGGAVYIAFGAVTLT
ncbi:MAG TPA: hypothetical protein VG013_39470, partial [Gemmataceae bacterium]|nr:hypothetical protein [Gemmataceae bacterium]